MSESRKYRFRAVNEWWRCAQYFVIASCGKMPRDNRCIYIYVVTVSRSVASLVCSGHC